jgi:predicted anti-sigma-YlaC factor YlaD
MTCKKAAYWLQLYIDGRLDRSRLARLEQHLHACAACREDRVVLEQIRACACEGELVAEPADLTERVLARIAAYEARRARSAEDWLSGIPAWALSWRSIVVAMAVVVALAFLFEPRAFARLSASLSSQATSIYALLMMPGPDSISWGIWAGGVAAALMLAVWFARADASSSLRRAIAERLPQLW